MKTKYFITFAGVPGSSKSPIAQYLSENLGLPIFNNDTLRTEVKEDLLEFDQAEFEKRRFDRASAMLGSGKPFIYDASVDRAWGTRSEWLTGQGHEIFIISMDLSEELLKKIYKAKEYVHFANNFDHWQQEHDAFLEKYGDVVNLHITDTEFPSRLQIALDAVRAWLST